MKPVQRQSALSTAGLVMTGLCVVTNLLVCWLLTASPPDHSRAHTGPTGGFDTALVLVFKLVVLVIFGGLGLVWTTLAIVFGAVGASRSDLPWQRVCGWVSIPVVTLLEVSVVVAAVLSARLVRFTGPG